MDINVQEWKEFVVERIFDSIYKAKAHTKEEVMECERGLHFVSRTDTNNGVDITVKYDNYDGIEKGNCITIGDTTATCYYQNEDFIAGDHMVILRAKWMNSLRGLFIRTLFALEYPRYSYGRAYRMDLIKKTKMKLPISRKQDGTAVIDVKKIYSDEGYIPDWNYMEDYIKSLHSERITTKITGESICNLNVDMWEEFKISDLFNVKYGINMELNTCDETTSDDPEGVAFVARTAENNGVSAYVKKIEGKEPQPAETITVAGGGSVLSTFVQKRSFYSGRDLYLLLPKVEMNLKVKIFIVTVLSANQYRYSYGRQANKTLSGLILKLPIQRNSKGVPIINSANLFSNKGYVPDWKFMEYYICQLPYSDRI